MLFEWFWVIRVITIIVAYLCEYGNAGNDGFLEIK